MTAVIPDRVAEGLKKFSPPEALGYTCNKEDLATFEGIEIDKGPEGIQEGCAVWWEVARCGEGPKHTFKFPLSSRSLTNPSTQVS
jgi:hypothetical protein